MGKGPGFAAAIAAAKKAGMKQVKEKLNEEKGLVQKAPMPCYAALVLKAPCAHGMLLGAMLGGPVCRPAG